VTKCGYAECPPCSDNDRHYLEEAMHRQVFTDDNSTPARGGGLQWAAIS
jgi:hypothetical protein